MQPSKIQSIAKPKAQYRDVNEIPHCARMMGESPRPAPPHPRTPRVALTTAVPNHTC
ncbi:hypothetical protein JYU34_008384 [Plutella xylostella]|uniref:Uncharacterized protein n=1 Tax=Plutella xylostella TaxID=51655 RepID=A0ABQ7QKT4_PLUXY|nr:hypothetical protein JYU34_008384 [Plutella xylostella]